jgi:peptidoglycan/LPS O-acetylase OafA/YrhL
VARIWPLFLVFAVIQHGTMLARGDQPDAGWLVTLTMTQSFFSNLVYEGLPVAWSLTVEECFYLIGPVAFGLLAWVLRGRDPEPHRLTWPVFLRVTGTLLAITVIVVGAGLAIVKIVQTQGWNWRGFMGSNFHMHHSTIFGRFPEFAIGMAAAFVHRGVDLGRLLRGWRATAATLFAFGLITACMGGKDALDHSQGFYPQLGTYAAAYGIAFGSALLILALSVEGGWIHRAMGWRLPVYLGKVSYGFYLIQLSVMMDPLVAITDPLGWARLPVLIVLTTVVCAAFYRVVEVPARRVIVGRWAG